MNRIFPVLLAFTALAMILSACLPGLPSAGAGADSVATSRANISTVAVLTLLAQPTQTPPPTNTALPTATVPTATLQPTNTAKPPISATAGTITVTATVSATGTTGASATPTKTATAGTPPSPTFTVTGTPPTATNTPGLTPRAFGTQPPMIYSGRAHLVNQSKRDVYVSFQCTTPEGYYSVVEYPVFGRITVAVPAGRCDWVAWVGGRQFTGRLSLSRFEEITMTFKKDRVLIK